MKKKTERNLSFQFEKIKQNKDAIPLAKFTEQAYLDYALSVVHGRAIPKLSDGLKPVQRRLLYSMKEMSLKKTSKPVKSARVVGDVLGKYHPHGDQSAYDAMVRMSQEFVMRYPLVDGQGNFGSRDGDSAAAMRYTEARLTGFAELLIDEIDMGTVQFFPNYDGSFIEPEELPARLPLCLLNGASGIAVGLSTEIPPHNLTDICNGILELIKNKAISNSGLLNIISGPDFPGGGQIINPKSDLEAIYANGKGTFKVQGRWEIEALQRGQWQLVFFELPHGVSVQKILEEVDDITSPKIKNNKKSLTLEQSRQKTEMLKVLATVRDESDKNYDVRLVFEPKNSKVDKEVFVHLLLAKTSLRSSVSLNLILLGLDGKPDQMSLKNVLNDWFEFRQKTVKLRTLYKLSIIQQRLHLLLGRFKVLGSIDRVIQIIRKYNDPRKNLMKEFALDEDQVRDILELRLKQLAKLELEVIRNEIDEKKKVEKSLKAIVRNKKTIERQIEKELLLIKKEYGDDRRTIIKESKEVKFVSELTEELLTIMISHNGWVYMKPGHIFDPQNIQFRSGDYLKNFFRSSNMEHIVVVSTLGRVYSMQLFDVFDSKVQEVPFSSLVEPKKNERFHSFLIGKDNQRFAVVTSQGKGLRTTIKNVLSRNKAGKGFLNLDKGDEPIGLVPLEDCEQGLAILSKFGYLNIIGSESVKELLKGGKGVNLMNLKEGDEVLSADTVGNKGLCFQCETKKGIKKVIRLSREKLFSFLGKRGQRGKRVDTKVQIINME